ncbi:DNA-3-methyladenine glycosylase family protein [Glutamicibacter arilaitensis]|uniref:DNA-3-methyladenine glycosylase family protein n=1 Tax=Glutamicibacter arilaitensis TaxID=256701 RepID=UPI00384F6A84
MMLTVPVDGVLDISHALAVLAIHSLPNQERLDLDEESIIRVLRIDDQLYETKLLLRTHEVEVHTQAPKALHPRLTEIISTWLGLADSNEPSYQQLATVKALRPALDKFPHLRLISYPDLFEALATTILGQQISTSAARTLATRFVEALGEFHASGLRAFPDADTTSQLSAEELQQVIRCPRSRAETLRRVASWFTHTGHQLAENQEEFLKSLLALKGVGPWTRDYIALRGLRQRSIFLDTDLVVKRAMRQLCGQDEERLQIPEGAGSLATILLWALDANKN